jgi:predicted TIM-barrel fold metal-dependent hydrolase
MQKPFVIDADGHIMESHPEALNWAEALPEPFRARAPRRIPFTTGGGRLFFEGKIWPMPFPGSERRPLSDDFDVHVRRPGMWRPEQRLPDMDLDGIDVAVCFGGVMALACSGIQDPELAAAMAGAYNDWAAGYCRTNPERLKFVAALCLQNPAAAARELERAVAALGAVAGEFTTNVGGRDLDHPDLDPVWAAAESLGVPVCVHGGFCMPGIDLAGGARLSNQFYLNLASFPFELMLAMAKVVAGGVLDRFPRLRVAFMEGNCGWLPFWLDRMDETYELLGSQVAARRRPSDYWREGRIWISCSYEETTLPAVVAALGADQIVYASDYWHFDAKFPGTVADLLERDLSEEAKRKILGENAARLYGIKAVSRQLSAISAPPHPGVGRGADS